MRASPKRQLSIKFHEFTLRGFRSKLSYLERENSSGDSSLIGNTEGASSRLRTLFTSRIIGCECMSSLCFPAKSVLTSKRIREKNIPGSANCRDIRLGNPSKQRE